MKVLVDTNILFSAVLFPGSKPSIALLHVAKTHEMYMCDQNISEFFDVLKRKAPKYYEEGQQYLRDLSYTLIPVLKQTKTKIRDASDQPILNAAIASEIDVILTGDKDFLSLDMKKPICVTADQYINTMM